jgi:hypothetical protein
MLELSGLVKRTPFLFTDLDGTVHELEISEFTIADTKKLVQLQKPILENKDMDVLDQSELIISSRIVCAVKVRGTNEYFWNSITDLTGKAYPNELGSALYTEVNKLNPVDVESHDEKKSES